MVMSSRGSKRELISIRTFLRQLQIEMEHELLSELQIKRNRSLRRELKDTLREAIDGDFRAGLNNDLDSIKADVRQSIQPLLDEIRRKAEAKAPGRIFQRLNLSVRLQHMLMAVSVLILIFSGLPLKFPEVPLFVFLMQFMGGIENSTLIHRIGACGLIAVSVWHLFYIIFFKEGRRDFWLMLPTWKDVKDFAKTMGYYFGRHGEKAKFGRFSYVEKFDYWAVYWGCVIMIGTGIALWSPELTFTYFPKYIYDIAKEVHSDEALLATLAIVIWHFYNVHFNPSVFPGSLLWFHGRIDEHDMKLEHPLEYDEIMAREAAEKQQAKESEDSQ